MFDSLGLEVKRLAHAEIGGWSDDELASAVVEVARQRAALEAAEARVLAEWDARRVWAASGAKSGAALLARETRQSLTECRARIASGRAMRTLPVAADAWLAGEISSSHVRALARACNPRSAALMARDEALLVEQATRLSFARFTRVVDYWSQHADPDGASDADLARRERRQVAVVEVGDGAWILSGVLDAIGGEILSGELERLERQLFEADWAEARLRLGREPVAAELWRTAGQRRADALVEMAKRSCASKGVARPLFTVVMGDQSLAALCELERSGRVVSPTALRDWIPEAMVEAVLFANGQRHIKVSRKRTFQGALRRLIEVRDRWCYHPTCEEPAPRCQGDHIEPFSAGGLTSPDNGRLACGHHNRLRHRRGPPIPS